MESLSKYKSERFDGTDCPVPVFKAQILGLLFLLLAISLFFLVIFILFKAKMSNVSEVAGLRQDVTIASKYCTFILYKYLTERKS